MNTSAGIPYYLEQQMKDTLDALSKLVKERGLERTMGYDLWEMRRQANEASAEQDVAKARSIVDSRPKFLAKVEAQLRKRTS